MVPDSVVLSNGEPRSRTGDITNAAIETIKTNWLGIGRERGNSEYFTTPD